MPHLRISSEQTSESAAGRAKCRRIILSSTPDSPTMASQVPNWPTRPEVPIPAAEAARLGIRHKLIRPYTPRHNGKVERSHREDQRRFETVPNFV